MILISRSYYTHVEIWAENSLEKIINYIYPKYSLTLAPVSYVSNLW